MNQKIKDLLLRLTSRKLWIAVAATITAYIAASEDATFTTQEVMTIVAPALAFIGVEGWADAKRAK